MKPVIEYHPRHQRHRLRRLAHVAAALLVLAIVVTWSWNTVVPELAAGPSIEFKHALALVALVASVGWLLRGGGWRRADNRSRHTQSR